MRSVPVRPLPVTFCVLIACFVSGPLLGSALGSRLAPESQLAQTVSAFAFPIAFFAGMSFWLGAGIVAVAVGALARLARGKLPAAAEFRAGETLAPPGYGAFVVLATVLAGVAGLAVGLLSDIGLLVAVPVYVVAGAIYGLALRQLAHHGYLPFPEPH